MLGKGKILFLIGESKKYLAIHDLQNTGKIECNFSINNILPFQFMQEIIKLKYLSSFNFPHNIFSANKYKN
jgi:hypothetical protein